MFLEREEIEEKERMSDTNSDGFVEVNFPMTSDTKQDHEIDDNWDSFEADSRSDEEPVNVEDGSDKDTRSERYRCYLNQFSCVQGFARHMDDKFGEIHCLKHCEGRMPPQCTSSISCKHCKCSVDISSRVNEQADYYFDSNVLIKHQKECPHACNSEPTGHSGQKTLSLNWMNNDSDGCFDQSPGSVSIREASQSEKRLIGKALRQMAYLHEAFRALVDLNNFWRVSASAQVKLTNVVQYVRKRNLMYQEDEKRFVDAMVAIKSEESSDRLSMYTRRMKLATILGLLKIRLDHYLQSLFSATSNDPMYVLYLLDARVALGLTEIVSAEEFGDLNNAESIITLDLDNVCTEEEADDDVVDGFADMALEQGSDSLAGFKLKEQEPRGTDLLDGIDAAPEVNLRVTVQICVDASVPTSTTIPASAAIDMVSNQSYTFVCSLVNKSRFDSTIHPHNLHWLIPETLDLEISIFIKPKNCEWGKKHWNFELIEMPDNIINLLVVMSSNRFTFNVEGVELYGNLCHPGEVLDEVDPVVMRVLNLTDKDALPDLVELLNIGQDDIYVGIYQSNFIFDPSREFDTQTGPSDPDECLITCKAEMAKSLEGMSVDFGGVFLRFECATAVAEYRCAGPVSGGVTADRVERSLVLKISEAIFKRSKMKFLRTESVDGALCWLFSYFPKRLEKPLPSTLKFGNEIYDLVGEKAPTDAPEIPGNIVLGVSGTLTPKEILTAQNVIRTTYNFKRMDKMPASYPLYQPLIGSSGAPTSAMLNGDSDKELTCYHSDKIVENTEVSACHVKAFDAKAEALSAELDRLAELSEDLQRVNVAIANGFKFAVLYVQSMHLYLSSNLIEMKLNDDVFRLATPEMRVFISKTLTEIKHHCIARECLSEHFQELFNAFCLQWNGFEYIFNMREQMELDSSLRLTDSIQTEFRSLCDKCQECLFDLQKVDLMKLHALIDRSDSLISAIKDKDVIVFLGSAGTGKSTLINKLFGARLVYADWEDSRQVLHPVFENTDTEERMKPFKCVHGTYSGTKGLHIIPLKVEGRTSDPIILDTPGLNDYFSAERGIMNSINLMRNLLTCRSVRLVFLMSIYDVDSYQGMINSLITINDIIPRDEDLQRITYLFTKVGAKASQDSIADFFNARAAHFSCQRSEQYLVPRLKDIEYKLRKDSHVLIHENSPTETLIAGLIEEDDRVIRDPCRAFGTFVSRTARIQIMEQLVLHKESIARLLARKGDHNPAYIEYQLILLRDAAGVCNELPEINQYYSECMKMVLEKLNTTQHALEVVKDQFEFSIESMSAIYNHLMTIEQLTPLMYLLNAETALLRFNSHEFLVAVKQMLQRRLDCALMSKNFVRMACALDDIDIFVKTFKDYFGSVIGEDFYSNSVWYLHSHINALRDDIFIMESFGRKSTEDELLFVEGVISSLKHIFDNFPLIERHFSNSALLNLKSYASGCLSRYAKEVAKDVRLSYPSHEAFLDSLAADIKSVHLLQCKVLECISNCSMEFHDAETLGLVTFQSLFIESFGYIAMQYNHFRNVLFAEFDKLIQLKDIVSTQRTVPDPGMILLLTRVFCTMECLYFDSKTTIELLNEAKRVLEYYGCLLSGNGFQDDIRAIGRGLVTMECISELFFIASASSSGRCLGIECELNELRAKAIYALKAIKCLLLNVTFAE